MDLKLFFRTNFIRVTFHIRFYQTSGCQSAIETWATKDMRCFRRKWVRKQKSIRVQCHHQGAEGNSLLMIYTYCRPGCRNFAISFADALSQVIVASDFLVFFISYGNHMIERRNQYVCPAQCFFDVSFGVGVFDTREEEGLGLNTKFSLVEETLFTDRTDPFVY